MGGIFNLDSTFMKYANKFADLMILNIITIIFCIPIFTIGASLTAMHNVLLKIYRDEESYIFKSFWKSFKVNFKQSTLMWLLYLVMAFVLWLDFWYLRNFDLNFPKFINYALVFIAILGVFSLTWVFVLQSRYDNKILNTIKNSLIVGLSHFFYTIMMVLLALIPILCLAFFTVAVPLCFALGFTLPGLLQTMLYSRVFDKIEGVDRKALKEQPIDDGWTLSEEVSENEEQPEGEKAPENEEISEGEKVSEDKE